MTSQAENPHQFCIHRPGEAAEEPTAVTQTLIVRAIGKRTKVDHCGRCRRNILGRPRIVGTILGVAAGLRWSVGDGDRS